MFRLPPMTLRVKSMHGYELTVTILPDVLRHHLFYIPEKVANIYNCITLHHAIQNWVHLCTCILYASPVYQVM